MNVNKLHEELFDFVGCDDVYNTPIRILVDMIEEEAYGVSDIIVDEDAKELNLVISQVFDKTYADFDNILQNTQYQEYQLYSRTTGQDDQYCYAVDTPIIGVATRQDDESDIYLIEQVNL